MSTITAPRQAGGGVTLVWRGDQVERAIRARLEAALRVAADELLAIARQLCPVDTGRLRDSLRVMVDGSRLKVILSTDVEYAYWVEFGTSRMPPNWFMRISMAEMAAKFEVILREHAAWGAVVVG
jgi:HK97 gp10 family phage protein